MFSSTRILTRQPEQPIKLPRFAGLSRFACRAGGKKHTVGGKCALRRGGGRHSRFLRVPGRAPSPERQHQSVGAAPEQEYPIHRQREGPAHRRAFALTEFRQSMEIGPVSTRAAPANGRLPVAEPIVNSADGRNQPPNKNRGPRDQRYWNRDHWQSHPSLRATTIVGLTCWRVVEENYVARFRP